MKTKKSAHNKTAHSDSHPHHQAHHHNAPKPPSKYLWLMEAILVTLGIFAVLSVILILFLAATNHRRAQQAVKFITGAAPTSNVNDDLKKIHSKIGFELTINTQIQEAEGVIISSTGEKTVKIGNDVFNTDNYSTVNVYQKASAGSVPNSKIDSSKATYLSMATNTKKSILEDLKTKYGQNESDIANVSKFFAPVSDQNKVYTLSSSEEVTIGGYKYSKNVYTITNNQSLSFTTKQTDYITVQNGRPYKITIYENAGSVSADVPQFVGIIETIKYYPAETGAVLSRVNNLVAKTTQNTLSPLVATANAASQKLISKDPSIQVVAKNNPAVVKVGTIYCTNFVLVYKNVSQNFNNACAGGTGSGSILNPEGYVATNGHVVTFDPYIALQASIKYGYLDIINNYLDLLVNSGRVSPADADSIYYSIENGNEALLAQLYQTLGKVLPYSQYKVASENYKYSVQLGNDNIKFDSKNADFDYTNNVVKAKLIDKNYNADDLYSNKGFTSSDVAILKLEPQNNYPFVSIGSIDSLTQGSPLTVIGFPGVSENELVNNQSNPPTSTKGQVSAIVDASGTGGYKLIQTDVGIAHGNSGGPGFNNDGLMVGIATYGITDEDASGTNINYLRNVADLKALADKNKVNLPSQAQGSQLAWENGLAKFSKAYYTPAIADFKKAQQLYPQNRLINEFIAKAEAEKKAGKEAIPPETYLLYGSIVLVVIIVPGIILLVVIRKHHKRRDIHQQYLQQGGMTNQQPSQTMNQQPAMVNPQQPTMVNPQNQQTPQNPPQNNQNQPPNPPRV